LAALNFYYPTFSRTLLVNHYPTINQWLGTFKLKTLIDTVLWLVLEFEICLQESWAAI
jgi:hypothetical protein